MRRTFEVVICAFVVGSAVSVSFAMWGVSNKGLWPENWPEELELLRKQSRTLAHDVVVIHQIPFTNRDAFERAWPHILKIKSKDAPLTLLRSPNGKLQAIKAGVQILAPPTDTLFIREGRRNSPGAESAIAGGRLVRVDPPSPDSIKSESGVLPEYVVYENDKWVPFEPDYEKDFSRSFRMRRARIEIELVVDGEIVDLNRISLPPETPIIDRRFEDESRD